MSTPRRSAVTLVAIAVRALPRGLVRDRYHHEFLAELHDLGHSAQLLHALRVLAHVGALRRAVVHGADARLARAAFADPPLHCRLHLYHRYRLNSTEDGHRYLRCADCGKDYPGTGNGPADVAGAAVIAGVTR